ncbi:MAG: hypothetical protein MJ231_03690 [bacterium]|nr:hypothetical protein [bacterium]
MAGTVSLFTKLATTKVATIGKPKAVSAFSRKFNKNIGEELTHRLTGQRYFRETGFDNGRVQIGVCPRELTKDGYRGITNEEFEALKKMQIRIKDVAYGNKTIIDDYTRTEYWGNLRKDGTTYAMMQDNSIFGRRQCPEEIWGKLKALVDVDKCTH